MPNSEHVELVKQGAEAIRRWREANPDKTMDLGGVEPRGPDPDMIDLRGADLRKADLRGADLHGVNLWEANLWEANLYEVRGAEHAHYLLKGDRFTHGQA
jgi:uncharacterized protein YjbI with pentapeptide repeats